MNAIPIGPELVGRKVCSATRPEWGVGEVLRVQTTNSGGASVHRISIQFSSGHRTLLVPPAQLVEPSDEPSREAGWLDTLAANTLDDRLCTLPSEIVDALGTADRRLLLLAGLYELSEEPAELVSWARRQAHVADPLSLWSRDELAAAFAEFCRRRDELARALVAQIRKTGGPPGVAVALAQIPEVLRARVQAAARWR